MSKKKAIIICIVSIIVLTFLGLVAYNIYLNSAYTPADDEIALNIQFDTKEDIGLLVFDYTADGKSFSGGISNADKSLVKCNSKLIHVFNKQELQTNYSTVDLSIEFRIITEYVDPNYENVYPEELTKHLDEISWKAMYGYSYDIIITGDKDNGYKAILDIEG